MRAVAGTLGMAMLSSMVGRPPAVAQGGLQSNTMRSPSAQIEADRLVDAGVALRRRQEHAAALDLFVRAHELAPSSLTLAQMGLAEEPLRRWEESEGHLAAALADYDSSWVQQHRAELEGELVRVRSHLGGLVLSGTPPGARVNINGRERGVLPLGSAVQVSEGSARVQITAPGYQPYVGTLVVPAHGVLPVAVALEPVAMGEVGSDGRAAVSRKGRVPDRRGPRQEVASPWKWAGLGLFGAGVASVVGGAAYLSQGPACENTRMCATTERNPAPGWLLVGSGLALSVVGGVLFFQKRDVQVVASVSPGVTLALRASFR